MSSTDEALWGSREGQMDGPGGTLMAFELLWKDKTTLDITWWWQKATNGSQTPRICGHQQTPQSHCQSIGGVEKMETVENWSHTLDKRGLRLHWQQGRNHWCLGGRGTRPSEQHPRDVNLIEGTRGENWKRERIEVGKQVKAPSQRLRREKRKTWSELDWGGRIPSIQ